MLLEYWELGRSELNTPGDMGGEKNDRVAGDSHRRLRVKKILRGQSEALLLFSQLSLTLRKNVQI